MRVQLVLCCNTSWLLCIVLLYLLPAPLAAPYDAFESTAGFGFATHRNKIIWDKCGFQANTMSGPGIPRENVSESLPLILRHPDI